MLRQNYRSDRPAPPRRTCGFATTPCPPSSNIPAFWPSATRPPPPATPSSLKLHPHLPPQFIHTPLIPQRILHTHPPRPPLLHARHKIIRLQCIKMLSRRHLGRLSLA